MKIEDIFKTLETNRVKYAVIGGVAVVLYGYVRFTGDIDLIIDFSNANVEQFERTMEELNFRPGPPIKVMDLANKDIRKQWIKEKNARVITFYNPEQQLLQIDILLTTDLSQIKTVRKKIDNFEISVIDYDDLIKMKKRTGRTIDLVDVEKLEELKRI